MNAEVTPDTAPDQPASRPSPATEARELLKWLQSVSPTFKDCRPLALRIDAAIHERFPEVSRKALRSALRLHTASTRYLKAVEKGTQRFDLDGQPAGEITDEQRSHAAATLKERFAKAAREQRERREAEENERRRQDKLNQLVNKFSR
ncbi:ProQ activator of osmoprotectant transporter prop [Pseudothauera nasutitermitis]|uniref:ProQ activator of osmoprotectant transporter prop n=1 Tax=Pseudothauera nasutitermitis TaxID=2565930 RepID=A0A4S4B008_9RHOO|nr:ProQ/FinO family protein [Pseudothauera nasutitermitis]THF65666.1 ProQ activator of osmoprotectant transporter prop [Pseudothauera nasutitermitis]